MVSFRSGKVVVSCARSGFTPAGPGGVPGALEATVTRVMPYGAFARVPTGIEGLIHISEIAPRRIASPAEVVHPGDLLRVRVVAIDPERRRLSLSVRQAAGNVVSATQPKQDANV